MTEVIVTQTREERAAAERRQLVSNVLGIAGIIILIVIAVWGLLHLATLSGGWFTSSTKNSTITVTAPKDVYSGESFHISWKYTPTVKGTYAILYQCSDRLRFSAPTSDTTYVPLPCGAAFTVGNATNTMTVLPLLAGTSTIAETISVIYIPSATSSKPVQGSAVVNVHPSAGVQQPLPATTSVEKPVVKPTKPSGSTGVSRGPADLAITLLGLSVDQFGNGVASFDIANIGGSSSGTYYFEAQLPTVSPYTYYSEAQASLSPGSHIVNTLNFSQATPGFFSASVDPQNLVRESNESNNTIGQYMTTPYPVY